jgi:LysM repeat protein
LVRFPTVALIAASSAVLLGCATTKEAPPPPAPAPAPAMPAAAPPPPAMVTAPMPQATVRDDAPLVYVVKKGDTLWGISQRFLLDPWQWPEVWYVNDKIANPHLIYPGDVLKLVNVKGRQMVRNEGGPMERVSPQVRDMPLEGAIPMIPLEVIREFLRGPRLISPEELETAPYLLAFVDDHIVGGSHNAIFVKNLPTDQGFQFSVLRKGETYRDPDNNDLLGYEGVPVGEAEVREYGQPATAVLARTSREALIGDRLLPVEKEPFLENFYPHAPAGNVGGRIISVFDGLSQIGQFQIVTINRGSNHGIEPGHVLDILQAGRRADDPYGMSSVKLPDTYAGNVLVFKTTPRVSFALVMSATRPVHRLDKVEKPGHNRS